MLSRQNHTQQRPPNRHNFRGQRVPQRHVARLHEVPGRRKGERAGRHVGAQEVLPTFRLLAGTRNDQLHRYIRQAVRIGPDSLPIQTELARHRKARLGNHLGHHLAEMRRQRRATAASLDIEAAHDASLRLLQRQAPVGSREEADVRFQPQPRHQLRELVRHRENIPPRLFAVVGGDSGELHQGPGLLLGRHQNRVLQGRSRRRRAVRWRPGSSSSRFLSREREVPPGRGGIVGRRFRIRQVEGGRGFGVRGDP